MSNRAGLFFLICMVTISGCADVGPYVRDRDAWHDTTKKALKTPDSELPVYIVASATEASELLDELAREHGSTSVKSHGKYVNLSGARLYRAYDACPAGRRILYADGFQIIVCPRNGNRAVWRELEALD